MNQNSNLENTIDPRENSPAYSKREVVLSDEERDELWAAVKAHPEKDSPPSDGTFLTKHTTPETELSPGTSPALNLDRRKAEFEMLRKHMSKLKDPNTAIERAAEDTPTEASPELIAELKRLRTERFNNKVNEYYGPSQEELTRRNLIIKSMQIDKDFITSKKIFIQELIKQDNPKFSEEIQRLQAEVEELKAKLREKRKDVAKSITTVIDEIEANTPGLSETLLKEQIKLKVAVKAERERGRPKDLTIKDKEAKNLANFQALLLKNKYAEDKLSEPEQLI